MSSSPLIELLPVTLTPVLNVPVPVTLTPPVVTVNPVPAVIVFATLILEAKSKPSDVALLKVIATLPVATKPISLVLDGFVPVNLIRLGVPDTAAKVYVVLSSGGVDQVLSPLKNVVADGDPVAFRSIDKD